MADNLTHLWRAVPLDEIMPYSRLLDDLERAGYETAGDVLDAEPWDLVDNVYGVGPKRAIAIRQKVFDYVKTYATYLESLPDWALDGVHVAEVEAPRTNVGGLLLGFGLCVLAALALTLLMAVMP